MRKAWLILPKKIISFHPVEGGHLYEADDKIFWKYIIALATSGYRMQ